MVLALRVQVFVVGHDWGAIVSWNLCLLRPDRVRALVNLSVAFSPRSPGVKPIEYFRAAYGDDYYVCRFQVSNCSSYRPNGCAAATYSVTEGLMEQRALLQMLGTRRLIGNLIELEHMMALL